jgi:hypothetical protein
MIKLKPATIEAIHDWWLRTHGETLTRSGDILQDPRVIERLFQFSIPGESVDDTILRVIRGGASRAIH